MDVALASFVTHLLAEDMRAHLFTDKLRTQKPSPRIRMRLVQLTRDLSECYCTDAIFVHSAVYLLRLVQDSGIRFSELNPVNYTLAAVSLASKFLEDEPYRLSSEHIAYCAALEPPALGETESDLMRLLEYRAFVRPEEANWMESFLSEWIPPPVATPPPSVWSAPWSMAVCPPVPKPSFDFTLPPPVAPVPQRDALIPRVAPIPFDPTIRRPSVPSSQFSHFSASLIPPSPSALPHPTGVWKGPFEGVFDRYLGPTGNTPANASQNHDNWCGTGDTKKPSPEQLPHKYFGDTRSRVVPPANPTRVGTGGGQDVDSWLNFSFVDSSGWIPLYQR